MPTDPVVLIRVAHHSPSFFSAAVPPHATLIDHVCHDPPHLDPPHLDPPHLDPPVSDPSIHHWRIFPKTPLRPSHPSTLGAAVVARAPARVYVIVPSAERAALDAPYDAAFDDAVAALQIVNTQLNPPPRVSVLVAGVLAVEHHADYTVPLAAAEILHGVAAPAVLRARLHPPTPPPLWASDVILSMLQDSPHLNGLSLHALPASFPSNISAPTAASPPAPRIQPPVLNASTPARVHTALSLSALPPLAAMQGASPTPAFELRVAPAASDDTLNFCTTWGASKLSLLVAIGSTRLLLCWQTDAVGYPTCLAYIVDPLPARPAVDALDDAGWRARYPAARQTVDVTDVPAALRALPVTDLPVRPSANPVPPDDATPSDLADLEIDTAELDDCLAEIGKRERDCGESVGVPTNVGPESPSPIVRKRPRSTLRADGAEVAPPSVKTGNEATMVLHSPRSLEYVLMQTRERVEGATAPVEKVRAATSAKPESGRDKLLALSRSQATTDSSSGTRRQQLQRRYERLMLRGGKGAATGAGGSVAGSVTVLKTGAVGKRVQSVPTRPGSKRPTAALTPRDGCFDRRGAAADADLRPAGSLLSACGQFYTLGDSLRGPDARDVMSVEYLGSTLRDVDNAGECTNAYAHMELAARRRGMHGIEYAPDVIRSECGDDERSADDRLRQFEDVVSSTRCEFATTPGVVGSAVLDKLALGISKLKAVAGQKEPATAVVAVMRTVPKRAVPKRAVPKKTVPGRPNNAAGISKEMVLAAITEGVLSEADLARIYEIVSRSKG